MTHKIYAIIGPSGAGKTTLADSVYPKSAQIVSFTSRDPRPGEIDGIDYNFIGHKTKSDIEQMKKDWANGKLVELVMYNGNVYGYTTEEIESKFNPKTKSAIAIVTKEGYDNLLKSKFKEYIIPIFVTASKKTIEQHLSKRHDSKENIAKRLALYDQEAKNEDWFNTLTTQKLLIHTDDNDISKISNILKKAMIEFERNN